MATHYRDFFHTLRGQECIVKYVPNDPGDWYIAPLRKDGSEYSAFDPLTPEEDTEVGNAIEQHRNDY